MAISFKIGGLWQATSFEVYSLDFASQRSFEKPQQGQGNPQPDHPQAERAGRKRRRAEEAKQPHSDLCPCEDSDGAQRLEGRWI